MSAMMPGWLDEELESAADHWGLLAAVGVMLIICGFVAIGTPVIASGAAVLFFGFLLLVGGLAAIIGGISARKSGGLAFYLVMGVLSIIAGVVILRNPAESIVTITLLIVFWLFISGIFRIVGAFMQETAKGWAIFSGIISILLAGLLWEGWPTTALWFLGLAVGIEMIFQGFAWLSIGFAAKRLKQTGVAA